MAPLPQLSIGLRNFAPSDPGSWEPLLRAAVAADRAGIDRVVVVDHVVFGDDLDDYGRPDLGGVAGGRQPTGPDGHWLEPLTVLSVIAGRTARVRLATGILIAALRRPVVLAKTLATLDVLSAGRVDVGVGVGWQRAEYAAADLPFEDRGRLLDESLELCRRLWGPDPVQLEGVGTVHQMPSPLQPGGVPIWISGRSTNRRVQQRVARFASGWIPWGDDAADPAAGIARLRRAMEEAGREGDRLQVTGTLPKDPDDLSRLVEAGVTDFRLRGGLPEDPGALEEHLAQVVEAFRAAVADRT